MDSSTTSAAGSGSTASAPCLLGSPPARPRRPRPRRPPRRAPRATGSTTGLHDRRSGGSRLLLGELPSSGGSRVLLGGCRASAAARICSAARAWASTAAASFAIAWARAASISRARAAARVSASARACACSAATCSAAALAWACSTACCSALRSSAWTLASCGVLGDRRALELGQGFAGAVLGVGAGAAGVLGDALGLDEGLRRGHPLVDQCCRRLVRGRRGRLGLAGDLDLLASSLLREPAGLVRLGRGPCLLGRGLVRRQPGRRLRLRQG